MSNELLQDISASPDRRTILEDTFMHQSPLALEMKLMHYAQQFSSEDRNRIEEAIRLVMEIHKTPQRDFWPESPFVVHPLRVAIRYATNEGQDATATGIIAALLHDAVEDTYYSLDDIENEFGPDVRNIDDQLTNPKDCFGSEQPQDIYMQKVHSPLALTLKAYDRTDNMIDLCVAYKNTKDNRLCGMIYRKLENKARETRDFLFDKVPMGPAKDELATALTLAGTCLSKTPVITKGNVL